MRIAALLTTLALCAVVAVALIAGGGSDGAGRSATRSHLGAVVEKRAAARARWLRSPRARRQRVQSRHAYVDLDRGRIAALVRRRFPATVDSVRSMVQPRDVRRYTSDYTAIVDAGPGAKAAGGTALAISSVPLRTPQHKPVDLTLRDRGGNLEPASALAGFTLPADLADGIELPSGVSLSLGSGHPDGVAPARIGQSTALYADVDTDTDLLAAASPRGVELFRMMRSTRSPATEALRLKLPPGASLRESPDGGVQVVRSRRPALSIAAPRASDAQGEAVPVSMRASGDVLRISVAKGDRDWAYPILVDPAIDGYAWADFPGWAGFNFAYNGAAPNTGSYSLSGDCMYGRECFGPGLNQYQGMNVYAWQGQRYLGGSRAGFSYDAPAIPSVSIVRATLGWVGYWNGESGPDAANPYMYAALWDTAQNGENTAQPLYQSYWFGTIDLSRVGDGPGVKEVRVGLASGATRAPLRADHHAYVGTATIYLDDTDFPRITSVFQSPWVDRQAAPIPLTVGDDGLGISSFTLSAPGGPSWQTSVGCAGGNRSPCPQRWSSPANGVLNYDPSVLPQGVDNLALTATDAAGHTTPGGARIRVDHTDPTLELSGSLATLSEDK
jgi:hypothetical protein